MIKINILLLIISILFRIVSCIKTNPNDLSSFVHFKLTGEELPACTIPQDRTIDERFRRLDKTRRRKITFDEFLYADQCAIQERRFRFNRIDLNGDHRIDKHEWSIEMYHQEQMTRREKSLENIELFKFFDKNNDNQLEAKELKQYIRFRHCNSLNVSRYLPYNRRMSQAEFNAFTYSLPSLMFPLNKKYQKKKPYYGDSNCTKPETDDETFHRLDKDKNYFLSVTEYLHLERCPIVKHFRKFQRLDKNHDGYVTLREMREFYQEREEFWQNVYNLRQVSVVHRYDRNNDMRLNKEELISYLNDRKIRTDNVDYLIIRSDMTPQEFARWEETLPNVMFPLLSEKH